MLSDILVAVAITVLAIVLGIAVHPVLFFLIVLAVVYLLARHRTRLDVVEELGLPPPSSPPFSLWSG